MSEAAEVFQGSEVVLGGNAVHKSCKLILSVIFGILDHHSRMNDDQDRVIGTLVGYDTDGVIQIRNAFPVLHTEGEQVGVDIPFHKTMLGLHRKVAPKEVLLGWYATGPAINEASVMINDFYRSEMNGLCPLHLTVDTSLGKACLSVKAWSHVPIVIHDKQLGSQFLPVPLQIVTNDHERIGLEAIKSPSGLNVHPLMSDLESLHFSVKQLVAMIDTLSDYVKQVLDGGIVGNREVGRHLFASLAQLPKIDSASLERHFQTNVQDLLLIVYLSNLTRAQLQISEKLSGSF